MAVISTLLSGFSITTFIYKAFMAIALYWAFHILSQLVIPKNPKVVPTVFSWIPIFGNAIEFSKDPITFLKKCQQKYGDVFTFQLLNKRVTACLGPDGNQFVFNAKQNLASAAAAYNHMTKYVFGDDIVFDAPHSVFMEQKRFIKAGLNIETFRKDVPLILDECNKFFDKFEKTGTCDAYKMFGSLIINTASRALLGPEIRNSLDDGVAKLYYDLDQGFRPINFMFPNLPLPAYRRRDEARAKLAALYERIIENRRKHPEEQHDDLLQTLMDSRYKDGSPIPDHQICGILTAALFGGQHTSSTTSAWTILELAHRPDIIKAVRQEMIDKLGSLQVDFTYDNLEELTLLEDVVRETLRLHPPIFNMMRRVVADKMIYEKSGLEIPKGNFLCAVPGVTQIDPNYFYNPMKWEPMRWSEKKDPVHQLEQGDDANIDYGFGAVGISSRSPFLPFGAGRHRCIGEKFGYLQLKAIIGTFIKRFDFETVAESVPKPDYTSMVVVPSDSRIRFTRRD
ncbi:lanosterol 14-alpha demethylase [Cokeromyces recurvatus]|uniref:lanosterol 14-alpha demethylase n=1 Tax=Cokeromyces recurvatus TaxID=90255 RepID=UPI0022200074|nr:lanosterol 14-alpha demethylase [Cokeromyces recurvatus]KAI7903594.1 lanosterol 14-alpha demethylase [Cokeromyces recurvatus]